jgi:hypothetical protein
MGDSHIKLLSVGTVTFDEPCRVGSYAEVECVEIYFHAPNGSTLCSL